LRIIAEFPLWFIILCLALGGVYALILYFNKQNDTSPWIQRTMAFFRFMVISIISFFLLSPLIKTWQNKKMKPTIIYAQDNSQSILLTSDSLYYKNEYTDKKEQFLNKLSDDYNIIQYSFGEKVKQDQSPSFTDQKTNFESLIKTIRNNFTNLNVGALILASEQ